MEDQVENQRQVELSKLPLFHANRSLDMFTAEQWVERIRRAKESARWNDAQTMSAVYNALRGKALAWFGCLVSTDEVNENVWEEFKTAFLTTYSTTKTSRTTTLHLADLRQTSSESVSEFYPRVNRVLDDIKGMAPENFPAPAQTYPQEIIALAGFAAVAADIKTAGANRLIATGAKAAFNFIGLHLFIAGLKPTLRAELMKTPPDSMWAAFQQAMALEKILLEPVKAAGPAANSIYEIDATNASPSNAEEGEDDEQLDQECNALAARLKALRNKKKKKQAPKHPAQPQQPKPAGATSDNYNRCRFCKQVGHLQKFCPARIQAGAPRVDKFGRAYQPTVNHIAGEQQTTAPATPQQQHAYSQVTQPPPPPPPQFNPFAHMMGVDQISGAAWASAPGQEHLN